MDNGKLIRRWHKAIITDSKKHLKRDLAGDELSFITSRAGLIALEMIEDAVKTLDGGKLKECLSSKDNK